MMQANEALAKIPDGIAFCFSPPAIPGIGTSGGVVAVLEDVAGMPVDFLAQQTQKFMEAVRQRPEIGRILTTWLPSVPQLYLYVDQDKVLKQGVELSDVYKTAQVFMGGTFVNYLNLFGRTWQVYVQADGPYRTNAVDIGQFYVRNDIGNPVPLSSMVRVEPHTGPEFLMRYNLHRCAQLNISGKEGVSTYQIMAVLQDVFAKTMPREMGLAYKDMSFQEQQAQKGVPPAVIFGISLLFVFLILAALYESWTLPFSVLLSTPIAVFGAFLALICQRVRKRRLFSDRFSHAHRSGGKERDPDCRICQSRVRKRAANRGFGVGCRPFAASADFDDCLRVHPRMHTAVDGCGIRRRVEANSWNDRYRRNAGSDIYRDFSDSGVVLRG